MEAERELTPEEQEAAKFAECMNWKNYSFEDKKAVLSKYSYTDFFTVGAYVDAQDTQNTWMIAQIVKIKDGVMEVNFDGWSQKWNM